MTTPLGLDPLYELRTRLQAISVANGYYTDAGARVYLGRRELHVDDVPAITIRQDDEQEAEVEVTASLVRRTVPYIIEGVVAADKDNPYEHGYELLADLDQAVFTSPVIGSERLSDTASVVEYTGSQVVQSEEGSAHCFARLLLRVTHTEKLGEPSKAS